MEQCDAHAHSVFADLSELMKARIFVPWTRRKTISRVALSPDMGVVASSPNALGESHHDWWPSPLALVPEAIVVEGSLE